METTTARHRSGSACEPEDNARAFGMERTCRHAGVMKCSGFISSLPISLSIQRRTLCTGVSKFGRAGQRESQGQPCSARSGSIAEQTGNTRFPRTFFTDVSCASLCRGKHSGIRLLQWSCAVLTKGPPDPRRLIMKT
jgi:hypothetical protein